MTTFKNNARYAELLFTYLDIAERDGVPFDIPDVLRVFKWRFKGGSLKEAAGSGRLELECSEDSYPDGLTGDIVEKWPQGLQAGRLRRLLLNRRADNRVRARSVMARVSTFVLLAVGCPVGTYQVYSGMCSIYMIFGAVWDWARGKPTVASWDECLRYARELLVGCAGVSRLSLEAVEEARQRSVAMMERCRLPGLWSALHQMKTLLKAMTGRDARTLTRKHAQEVRRCIEGGVGFPDIKGLRMSLGPLQMWVAQGVSFWVVGPSRFALSQSDAERLHQLLMSSCSALVGVCTQASVGTQAQMRVAKVAVEVAEANLDRIVKSTKKVALGDEVLVCKGYRRAYTAYLGVLAGPLCREETQALIQEAQETADSGVIDVEGFLDDARRLDAASGLNACKMFKACPAPDVSPGAAMIDRMKQTASPNVVDPQAISELRDELRTQILRAYIRARKSKLHLRDPLIRPIWMGDYLREEYDKVPSHEIHQYLAWEGTAEFPDLSPFEASCWKDSGLGADTIAESEKPGGLGNNSNMLSRLVFDDDCPMPGRRVMTEDHVIKFFVKAEGHKDPARGIFSANLVDRQAQSWLERAVHKVAIQHPSYMIGQPVDVREAKVAQLNAKPVRHGYVALFYSFDIKGWSASMPKEPQRMSHALWAELYDEPMFGRAHRLNEGAHIYLNLDGYRGWFKNAEANLEGFNGKEMTMILVALLSLAVRRWRRNVVAAGLISTIDAASIAALLFAYIDDGLSRVDLPKAVAVAAFREFQNTVVDTFDKCGFKVEVTKCFPSDRFSIFLNEVYLAGRHVVHGVRAAMAISSEPTERHTSLVERLTSVSTGVRGAVMAGLSPVAATMLMAYHSYMHIEEWVEERDPVLLAAWSVCPRAWGGLGMPNMLQLYTSGSGSAFEEGVATMGVYARSNLAVSRMFVALAKTELMGREAVGVLAAPLSARVREGYMVDSRVVVAVRKALQSKLGAGELSRYATRLLRYANTEAYREYADCVVPLGHTEVVQEQMLINLSESHPHAVFASFARRLEKANTITSIIGMDALRAMVLENRMEARASAAQLRKLVTA